MNPQQLIEMNNEKRELLTEENERIYSNMLVYIRMASIAEHHVEEVLIDVLDHLLDAQEYGETAYDVFGKNPKEYCDELIEALPKYTLWQEIYAYRFIPYLLLCITFSLEVISVVIARIFEHPREEVQTFIINPLGILCEFFFVFLLLVLAQKYIRKSAFKQDKETIRSLFLPWLITSIIIGCVIGGNILFKKLGWLTFSVPLGLGILLSILSYALYKISFNRREK
ncbi:DUF1129 domain-containing protein [Priestia taiwanensis]|uniref:DUF1129 domain-containing protein n=1 Tax=Priestia taiwanensis TaxID=1347902 RepID=A0A917ATT1_9BACI|nr:DUF1129 domain-containing protein [Priestia taiwanensis]MBM7363891.1 DNA-binding ferritin-like protein (Dps family) [Priestia taiwanensis]GGE69878.1 hypothetical protein GCM10007140_19840 [Priestia taiwanensis]